MTATRTRSRRCRACGTPLDPVLLACGFTLHPCCEFDCNQGARVTAPGKWHLVVDLGGDIGQVWADWRDPIISAINAMHAARAAQQPDPPQARALIVQWWEQHREQSLACQERRCDH